jgi:hypothetical protein
MMTASANAGDLPVAILLTDLMLITTAAIAYRAKERGDDAQLAWAQGLLAENGPTSASLVGAIQRATDSITRASKLEPPDQF